MSGRSPFAMRWRIGFAVCGILFAGELAAQTTASVSGRVTDEAGAPLSDAQVTATDEQTGLERQAFSGPDGRYALTALRAGARYRIEVRLIGYGSGTVEGVVLAAGEARTLDFALGSQALSLDAIEVFAERAIERRTPVAHTDVPQTTIRRELGSRDMPLLLNTTPSVYATAQGGGAGDARVNVRGFSQENVAIMINGVPINDMENGWVYWSNWDGIGDATRSVQVQRGLSAVNLATPSIGGTMNIVTDAAAMAPGITAKQEFGQDGFRKTTIQAATGMIDDRFALSVLGVRKTEHGYYDGTWYDGYAYHVATSFVVDDRNRLELFALGGPQRHGQNLFKQNIAAYSHELARETFSSDVLAIDEDGNGEPDVLEDIPEAGRRYNQNYNTVSCDYTGEQAVEDETFERHDCRFLNERENFFHKPQVNLNWYSQLSDRLYLSTVAYYSGGEGGGTGTAGDIIYDVTSAPTRIPDWDATIAMNQGIFDADGNLKQPGRSMGILRNSRNNQWTVGAISKLRAQISDPLTVQFGLDWRTAEIEHYREIRDLLGGEYYIDDSNEFATEAEQQVGLGDKVEYDFTNTVDWFGAFAQGEYAADRFTAYGMTGISTIAYTYTNHFVDDGTGNELYAETDNIWGFQVKGGGLYNVSEAVGVFANAGYVSKVPIFDGVINDISAAVNPDPKNEKFISLEAGAEFRLLDGLLDGRLNVYRTAWSDRTETVGVILEDGSEGLLNLLGLDALHQGVELEVAYQPSPLVRFDAAASIADWHYTNDVSGEYRPDDRSDATEAFNFYVKDLKVGDAPQTQFAYAATVFPTTGAYLKVIGKTYANHYAQFNPFSRTSPTFPDDPVDPANPDDPRDRGVQSWKAPGYTVFDIHAGYELPLTGVLPVGAELFLNVFNAFDALYVQDAVDNSAFSSYDEDGLSHLADDAEVFLGMPRRINFGITVRY